MNLSLSIGQRSLTFDGTPEEFERHVAELARVFWLDNAVKEDVAIIASAPENMTLNRQTDASAGRQMTMRAVATALGGETGGDLLYAAAAFLAVIERRETFTRAQILESMKTAVGFYKPSYSGNLSSYLDSLSKKGVLIETSNQVFAVKASELDSMSQRLLAAA